MFRRYLTTYLNRIYEDRLLKCGWFCKHLTTVDHADHLCIKCVGNTSKNHCSEVFEDKLQFLWKSHSSVGRKYLWAPTKLYYRISDWNTLIQQFIYLKFKPKWLPAKWFWLRLVWLVEILVNWSIIATKTIIDLRYLTIDYQIHISCQLFFHWKSIFFSKFCFKPSYLQPEVSQRHSGVGINCICPCHMILILGQINNNGWPGYGSLISTYNKPIKHNYCNFRTVLGWSCFSNNKIWLLKLICVLDSKLQSFSWSVSKNLLVIFRAITNRLHIEITGPIIDYHFRLD